MTFLFRSMTTTTVAAERRTEPLHAPLLHRSRWVHGRVQWIALLICSLTLRCAVRRWSNLTTTEAKDIDKADFALPDDSTTTQCWRRRRRRGTARSCCLTNTIQQRLIIYGANSTIKHSWEHVHTKKNLVCHCKNNSNILRRVCFFYSP